MLAVRSLVYWMLINVFCAAAESRNKIGAGIILAFFFYDLVVSKPIWPYPDGKVTWPWKRGHSKK